MKPSQQVINNGTYANDGTGDTLRDATKKINNNFTQLWGDLYDSSRVTGIICPSYVENIIDSDHVMSKVSFETQSIRVFGDVDSSAPAVGDALIWDGSVWNPSSPAHIDYSGLPKSDPLILGRLWRDSDNDNVLKVSRG